MHRSKITVFPAGAWTERKLLLQALTELYPVDFIVGQDPDPAQSDAALLFGVSRAQALRAAQSGRPCVAFVNEPPATLHTVSGGICFAALPFLHASFRGRSLPHSPLERVAALIEQPGDTVVARSGGHILWIQSPAGLSNLQLLAAEPPHISEEGNLFQFFKRDDWMRLFPLLHFLRELSGLEPPTLRACFMFDDPNLHWKSYGYVQYPQLIQHANRHNYHVSFATVPLDTWYTHKGTAALFRENQNRLSLLFHGNNHTHRELSHPLSDQARQALVAQALHRIARLEHVSGLKVPRVIAAPHGACSAAMADVLLRMGFEAACISRGSIMAHNKDKAWPRSVGLHLAEFLGTGLPVIPRFGLAPGCQTEILLASFLGQSLIQIGHHEDIADGLDLLQSIAELINSLGDVQWTELGSIARSRFSSQRQGSLLHVKMYSRLVRFIVPADINEVCIGRAWLKAQDTEGLGWRDGQLPPQKLLRYNGEHIQTRPGAQLEISSILSNAVDPAKVLFTRPPLWAIGRRHLCEARDRARPAVDRLRRFARGKN
jgi:hypothetical protein